MPARAVKKATKPAASMDDFLKTVPPDKRAALQKIRAVIRSVVPTATETISYGVPTYKLDGKGLVGFGAATAHCTFFLMSTKVLDAHRSELVKYDLGGGSIRFPASRPLPKALVTKLVKARIAEVKRSSGAYSS